MFHFLLSMCEALRAAKEKWFSIWNKAHQKRKYAVHILKNFENERGAIICMSLRRMQRISAKKLNDCHSRETTKYTKNKTRGAWIGER